MNPADPTGASEPATGRRRLLVELGAEGDALQALDDYVAIAYPAVADGGSAAALPEEPQVPFWRRYVEEAATIGVGRALALRFPQLGFPIAAGISECPEYRRATRLGEADEARRRPAGIQRDDLLSLRVEESVAGAVPVLVARHRPDFVFLVRALTARNEPEAVPDAMGACLVKGLVSWDRVAAERRRFEAALGREATAEEWNAEMAERIRPKKELWQDRLILLSDGDYSALPAAEAGFDAATWRARSLEIRTAHECFHYLTLRHHGGIRSHLLDELLADFAGLVAAFGRYDAALALRFLGLGAGDAAAPARPGGRWEIYRRSLPDAALPALARLIEMAAEALATLPASPLSPAERARQLLDLAAAGLDGIAARRIGNDAAGAGESSKGASGDISKRASGDISKRPSGATV